MSAHGKLPEKERIDGHYKLSFSVVLSALAGYLFNGGSDWKEILLLTIGGTLVTAASNGSNQIWERDLD
ncbi:hypothetical protein ANCCEY_15526, partial [Ancylostoma ceylanicum]